MNVQQKEIIRLVKAGYSTTSEVARHLGTTQHQVSVELRNLVELGLLETNLVKTAYFVE